MITACSGIVRNNSIWDKIVFKKVQVRSVACDCVCADDVQATLGGRVRVVLTGAAPISKAGNYHMLISFVSLIACIRTAHSSHYS